MTINYDDFCNKAEAYEAFNDIPTTPHLDNTIGDVIYRVLFNNGRSTT